MKLRLLQKKLLSSYTSKELEFLYIFNGKKAVRFVTYDEYRFLQGSSMIAVVG